MLEDVNILYIIGPTVLLLVIGTRFTRARISKYELPLPAALGHLKVNCIALGTFLVVLWFLMPSAAGLSTFGYPASIESIQSPKLLLDFLQQYNRALVRVTWILYWFIFVFTWWFLSFIYDFAKAITKVMSDRSGRY